MYRRIARGLTIAAGLLADGRCVYLSTGTFIALKLTAPVQQVHALDARLGPSFQPISLTARDGLRLAGWFLPAPGSKRGVLMVHGVGSLCEFGGRFIELGTKLNSAGFSVLMIDLRAHGQSTGGRVTFGEGERWDVLGGVDLLHERGSTQVGVLGVSLGAVSTVRAELEPDGPQAIRAMVLDSCFGDFADVLDHSFADETGYPTLLLPGGLLMTKLLSNVDMARVRPIDQLPKLKTPLLLIYGQRDRYVTASQQQAMVGAVPGAQTWLAPDAEHARIYTSHQDEYLARVTRFLETTLQ
jgi:uncharacterized protein